MINFKDFSDKYFYVFADCFLVRGYTRTMLLDVTRNNYIFLDNDYATLLKELSKHKIGIVMSHISSDEGVAEFNKLLNYIYENEQGEVVDEISLFPPINLEWDTPAVITNAIIDIAEQDHDYCKIVSELNALSCRHIQLRSYTVKPLRYFSEILEIVSKTDILSVEVLTKYDAIETEPIKLMEAVQQYSFATFTVHSSPQVVETPQERRFKNHVLYISQELTSCGNCGIINRDSFITPSLGNLMENILFNSCLNRKISIDQDGQIKNCPSMKASYGAVSDTSLLDVLQEDKFKGYWNITKDTIDGCRDCEYRYVCTDCRGYTTDEENLYAKPLKCQYNPYTGVWATETQLYSHLINT